jgi:hypothetical protein
MAEAFAALTEAAKDKKPVAGWTHTFYRYPARFSPQFAAAAIAHFSRPGELVLDPYMGGGTAVVEGMAAGRHVIGNDLNSLAAFVTKVKTTGLTDVEVRAVQQWAADKVPDLKYNRDGDGIAASIDLQKTRNLSLVKARFIKKAVAIALAAVVDLPTRNAQDFVRCAVLRVSQWALDGRERHTPLSDFRDKLANTIQEMLESLNSFTQQTERAGGQAVMLNSDAKDLGRTAVFSDCGNRVSLVVTSPPYPGVHMLYHRWQVDGRRETPAPYWIAGCDDGQGASFYNFGDRRQAAADNYFRTSLATLKAIRGVMRNGGCMVQMLAFNRPDEQLPRYLENMEKAGFAEAGTHTSGGFERIWRIVPSRKWHARLKGNTASAREVVLFHIAV